MAKRCPAGANRKVISLERGKSSERRGISPQSWCECLNRLFRAAIGGIALADVRIRTSRRGAMARAHSSGAGTPMFSMRNKTISSVKISTGDLEAARALLDPYYPGIRVQPGADGGFQIDLQTDILAGVVTHQLATATGARFSVPEGADAYMLVILDEGGIDIEVRGTWYERRAPSFLMLDAERLARCHVHPGRYEMILVDAAHLHKHLAQALEHPAVQRIRFHPTAQADTLTIRLARDIVSLARLLTEERGYPRLFRAALPHLVNAAVATLLEIVPHNYSGHLAGRHPGPSPKHIRRAIEFIHANAKTPLSVEDIAKACHVSVRSLQFGFARFHGLTPFGYLKQVRLEGVHADLCAAEAGQSIASIARQWQFLQPGQFALEFRKAFGATPSQVRRTSGSIKD